MKISIITVVYNNEDTIKDAIESVLNQTYKNIEYIIIDGGSTDGTIDIIKSYGNKIDKFITEKDNGIYDAMNKGIKLATGNVIGILNSDDFYNSNKIIENIMEIFEIQKVDSVYGDLIYVDDKDINKVVRYWKSSKFKKGSFSKGWHPPHPTFFVKKEIYDRCGGFNLNMKISADFELMLRFLEKCQVSTFYLNEILVKMRIGGESNQSIKNIILGNKDILRAFTLNQVQVNKILYPFYRLTPKVFNLIKNKLS